MKKIYLFIALLAISCICFPGRASALALQIKVDITTLKIPNRGLNIDPSITPQSDQLQFYLGYGGGAPYLAVWQDGNDVSGSTFDVKNGGGYLDSRTTSTTAVAMATSGNKTFIIGTHLPNYTTANRARVQSRSNPSMYMEGPVKSYDSTTGTLVFAVDSTATSAGTGTYSDWDVTLAPVLISSANASTKFYDSANYYNYIFPGSSAVVTYDYSVLHTYSVYIGLSTFCSGSTQFCKDDCSQPSITAGKKSCGLQYIYANKPGTKTWSQASCYPASWCQNNATSKTGIYLGQIFTTDPDPNFYIFLKHLY